MEWIPRALLLTSNDNEAHHLREELEGDGFVVSPAKLDEVLLRLKDETYDAVFCASSFYNAYCGGAFEQIREHYPGVPVMVISRSKAQI